MSIFIFNAMMHKNDEYNVLQLALSINKLVSARPSELDIPGSILGDCKTSNICFDFLRTSVALALNTRKTEH